MAEVITNHALIRYFQRYIGVQGLDLERPTTSFARLRQKGYDVAATRAKLTTLVGAAVALGAHQVRHEDVTFKISDGAVVTVYVGQPTGKTVSNKRHGQRIAYRESRAERGLCPRSSRRWREDRP